MPGGIGYQINASTVTAVTAVGAAPGHKFFTAKGDRSVAAAAAANFKPDFVNKNCCTPPQKAISTLFACHSRYCSQ